MQNPFHTLRGVLAIWVLLGHMLLIEWYGDIYNAGFATHTDFGALGKLSLLHFMAVDIFFMLSGLVLTLRYGSQFTRETTGRQIDRFYLHRFWRVWPLHVAMVLLIGGMHLANIPHPISSGNSDVIFRHWEWTLGLNLLLMNGWGMMPVASWNEPAWTLSVTFLLYVLFPNLMLLLNRVPPRKRLMGGLIVVFLALYYAQTQLWPTGSFSDGVGALVRGFVFFTCGMLLARGPRLESKAQIILGLLAFPCVIALWLYVAKFPLVFVHLTYPLLLAAVLSQRVRVVPLKLAHWLGDRSFAIFITHYPVLLLIRHFMGESLHAWASEGGMIRIGCYILVIGLCLFAADIAARADGWVHKKRQ